MRFILLLLCSLTITLPAYAMQDTEEDIARFIDKLDKDEGSKKSQEKQPSFTASGSELLRVQSYLNSISTFVAEFMQVAPDGSVSSGTFFLSRPGKLRWQYNPPVPILIVANGNLLTYYDYELDQVSHVSPETSLAAFLTRKTILFSGDISVKQFKSESGILRLSIVQTNKPEEGQLTLVLNNDPLQLKKLELKDSAGQETFISFSNIKLGMKLDDKLFIVKDPKLFKKRV